MSDFGLVFTSTEVDASLPGRYVPSRVRIGELDEALYSDVSVWGVDDYCAHWLKSAQVVVAGRTDVLFASSLGKRFADVWFPRPVGESTLDFYSLNIRVSAFKVVGRILVPGSRLKATFVQAPEHWSRWSVPIESLRRYTSGAHSEPALS